MSDPFDRVRAVALALPGVEEALTFGTPALKVRGKFLAQLWSKDHESLVLSMEIVERDLRINAEPDIFFITGHFRDWPGVLVRMDRVNDAYLRELIESAWHRRAPKKLVKAYDVSHPVP